MRRQFRLHGQLGKGGFGEVYEATMRAVDGSQWPVAIKLWLANTAEGEEEAWRRLIDEHRTLSELAHPNIVRCHALTQLEGHLALITDLIDGATLGQCLTSTTPLRVLVEMLGQAATALHAAYTTILPGRGPLRLVHRDLKPSNLMVSRKGSVVLLDFGLAHSPALPRVAQTAPNMVVGTPNYLAPERVRRAPIHPGSDVFALGALAYRVCAGRHLLAGLNDLDRIDLARSSTEWANLIKRRFVEGPRWAEHPELLHFVSEMLAWDPEVRPTAREVAAICSHLALGLPGPDLVSWARSQRWPTEERPPGPWTGKVVEEDEEDPTISRIWLVDEPSTTLDTPALLVSKRSTALRSAASWSAMPPRRLEGPSAALTDTSSGWGALGLAIGLGLIVIVATLTVGFSLGMRYVASKPPTSAVQQVAPAAPSPVPSPARAHTTKPPASRPTATARSAPVSRPKPTPKEPAPSPAPGPGHVAVVHSVVEVEVSEPPPARVPATVVAPSPTLPAPEQPGSDKPVTPPPARIRLVTDAPRTWVIDRLGRRVPLQAPWTELPAGTHAVGVQWHRSGSVEGVLALTLDAGMQTLVRCVDSLEVCGEEPITD